MLLDSVLLCMMLDRNADTWRTESTGHKFLLFESRVPGERERERETESRVTVQIVAHTHTDPLRLFWLLFVAIK